MKRAFIVSGAEHSGNRLMAGLIASCGVWGRGTNNQPRPGSIPSPWPDEIVIISHLYDELVGWDGWFRGQDYEIHVVVVSRNPWVQVRSRSKAANKSTAESRVRYDSDYRGLFRYVGESGVDFTLVPYEALLQDHAPRLILLHLGLQQVQPLMVMGKVTEIRDENEKWLTTARI